MKNLFTRLWCAVSLMCATALHAEPLLIGVEDNRYLPHYSFEDGEYTGFGRDVLEAFFAQTGLKYEFRALPVTRLFSDFIDGQVDFKYPDNEIWSPDDKNGLFIRYSDPVVDYIDGVSVVPANIGVPVNEVKIIGTVRGFSAWGWQDRIDSGDLILSENSSTEKLIEQAFSGRIHGAYANIDVIQHIIKTQFDNSRTLVFDASLPHTRSSYRLSSHKHPQVIKQFNLWLNNNAELMQSLKRKYKIPVD